MRLPSYIDTIVSKEVGEGECTNSLAKKSCSGHIIVVPVLTKLLSYKTQLNANKSLDSTLLQGVPYRKTTIISSL